MGVEPPARRTLRRTIDAPAPPDEVALTQLQEGFRLHREIAEAWLVGSLLTPPDGTAFEAIEIGLALDPALADAPEEGEIPATVRLVAELSTLASKVGLDVHGWLFVNDAIRADTERHGLKIYSRDSTSP